jgi:hypothetical protein
MLAALHLKASRFVPAEAVVDKFLVRLSLPLHGVEVLAMSRWAAPEASNAGGER